VDLKNWIELELTAYFLSLLFNPQSKIRNL